MKAELQRFAHIHDQYSRELAATILQTVQGRVNGLYDTWCSEHVCPEGGRGQVTALPGTSVRYVGMHACGDLNIPSAQCAVCLARCNTTAIQAGCFNSSPTDPHAWFDLDLHKSFSHLVLHEGLSATGKKPFPFAFPPHQLHGPT